MKYLYWIVIYMGLTNAGMAQLKLTNEGEKTSVFPLKAKNQTAIIGAFQDEIELLKAKMLNRHERHIQGLTFYIGKLKGRQVVLVRSGIGKVNAAFTTTLLLEHFRPREVLFTGIAGSVNPDVQPGDIVLATEVAHHDYGRVQDSGMMVGPTRDPYQFNENPTYFHADSSLFLLASFLIKGVKLEKIGDYQPLVRTGIVATGDVLMSSTTGSENLHRTMKADAVEMEGAAVGQLCYQQKVPFLIIRSISDRANHSAQLDMNAYGAIAARNSAALVLAFLERLK
ncbi:MAG: 5'-methylthioadenosine/adenosylhomocysteine nucleosidase [Siphonobacter sp.]